MNDLIRNKKTVVFCILLLLFFIVVYFIYINKDKSMESNIKNDYKEITKYDANKIVPIYITEEDMAKKYYIDYKNILIKDTDLAYEMLNNDYKVKRFDGIDDFKDYLEHFISVDFYSSEISEYDVVSLNGNNIYYLINNEGKKIIIKEKSIMDYEVYLDEYTVKIK